MTFGRDVIRQAFICHYQFWLHSNFTLTCFLSKFLALLYKNLRTNPCYYSIEWFYEYLFRNPCFIPEFVYYIEFVWFYCDLCLFLAFCKSVLNFVCIFTTYVHFLQFVYCSRIWMGFWCNFFRSDWKPITIKLMLFMLFFIANMRILIWIEFVGAFNELFEIWIHLFWALLCKLSILVIVNWLF